MTDGTHLIATTCHKYDTGQPLTATELDELRGYLWRLCGDLDVEIDLHGGRTVMAYNLRTLIIQTRKVIEAQY